MLAECVFVHNLTGYKAAIKKEKNQSINQYILKLKSQNNENS